MIKKLVIFLFAMCICSSGVYALESCDISAECAAVVVKDTGELVFGKDENKPHSMASTTKIMTALLAVESGRLNDEIIVTKEMLKVEGTSMGLMAGDSVSVEELAYGMLLPSGNDAANVTAIYLGEDVNSFSKMMNLRAVEIGMKNTNFVTPSGLDDDNHYSTAYDMAILGATAVHNKKFLSICSSKKANLTYGNPPYVRTLYNHNRLLTSYKFALGIKTGFTKKSGRCLVSYAEKDGVGLVAVTLNDKNDWYDHKLMLDSCFEKINSKTIKPDIPQTINVVGGEVTKIPISCEELKYASISNNPIEIKTYINKFLYAPVKQGDVVGHSDIYINDKLIGSVSITADENVDVHKVVVEKQVKKGFIEKIKERLYD